eukprot:jgi/Botrbrau1/4935/Bobra.0122s0017.1
MGLLYANDDTGIQSALSWLSELRELVIVTQSQRVLRTLFVGLSVCPHAHQGEVAAIFPGVDPKGMLVVPTCQHAKVDLVRVGDAVEGEKDRLLERFVEWAKAVTGSLISRGHWADYIDPASGLPMVDRSGMVALWRGGRPGDLIRLQDCQCRLLQGSAPPQMGQRCVSSLPLHQGPLRSPAGSHTRSRVQT